MKTPEEKRQRSMLGRSRPATVLRLSIALAAFFTTACKLLAPEITEEHSQSFVKLCGEEKTVANDFILKEDGGFYIMGTNSVDKDADKIVFVETDKYGNPMPAKIVETGFDTSTGKSFLLDADGKLLFLGEYKKQQAFLTKKTSGLDSVWRDLQRSAPKYNEIAVAVTESPDGSGYLVLADTDESPDADRAANLLLYKTDKNGKLLWRQVLGFDKAFATSGSGIKDNGFGLHQSPAGEISIFLNIEIDRKSYMALIVTNALGDITAAYRYDSYVWELKDGVPTKTGATISATGTKVSKANDGFVICGTQGLGDAIIVKKINGKGVELWECAIDINPGADQVKSEFGVAAIQTSDGGYAVCGTAYHEKEKEKSKTIPKETDFFGEQIFFAKLDSKGIMKAIGPGNYFGGFGQDKANDLLQTADGGFALLGTVSIEGNQMMTLIKLDAEGNLGVK